MLTRFVLAIAASYFLRTSPATAQSFATVKVMAPVEIVTNAGEATAEILVEISWTNHFDRPVSHRTDDIPQFSLFDAAGHIVDTFVVTTKPGKDQKQIEVEKKEVVIKPKESYRRLVKVWVSGLAMEPGRCYLLGDYLDIDDKAPFVPLTKDGREKLRDRAYTQTVRIKSKRSDQSATIFDVDKKNGTAFALSLLPKDDADEVEVFPIYHRTREIIRLYDLQPCKGRVRRSKLGLALVEFPLAVSKSVKLDVDPIPLAAPNYDYTKDTFIACGWNPTVGVSAPCSAIRREIKNGFSTIFATPREGWRGGGYYSNSGYLVGICDSAANPEGHSNRLGAYVGLPTIHGELKELGYTFSEGYGKKQEKKK